MKVLIVKTSSLGDVIHTLPAVSDLRRSMPAASIDWVLERGYSEIPTWHPGVRRVIPIEFRRWRKAPAAALRAGVWGDMISALRRERYDRVVDAQGLLKSAILTRMSRGLRCGLDRSSAREPLAASFYQRRYAVSRDQHAVTRVRALFAGIFGYATPTSAPDYGVAAHFEQVAAPRSGLPRLVFLHGTTWTSKQWPDSCWADLARQAVAMGFAVRVPWGNAAELQRAEWLAGLSPNITLIPAGSLSDMAVEIAAARAVIGVDTGLAHLAAALAVPTVTLYGATDPDRTGTRGARQRHLRADFHCAPCLGKRCSYSEPSDVFPACYTSVPAARVWKAMCELLDGNRATMDSGHGQT